MIAATTTAEPTTLNIASTSVVRHTGGVVRKAGTFATIFCMDTNAGPAVRPDGPE
jgi:hypothetical protein